MKTRIPIKLSARNVLQGTVESAVHGAVNSNVVLTLSGGAKVVSVITKESAEQLGLKKSKESRPSSKPATS